MRSIAFSLFNLIFFSIVVRNMNGSTYYSHYLQFSDIVIRTSFTFGFTRLGKALPRRFSSFTDRGRLNLWCIFKNPALVKQKFWRFRLGLINECPLLYSIGIFNTLDESSWNDNSWQYSKKKSIPRINVTLVGTSAALNSRNELFGIDKLALNVPQLFCISTRKQYSVPSYVVFNKLQILLSDQAWGRSCIYAVATESWIFVIFHSYLNYTCFCLRIYLLMLFLCFLLCCFNVAWVLFTSSSRVGIGLLWRHLLCLLR